MRAGAARAARHAAFVAAFLAAALAAPPATAAPPVIELAAEPLNAACGPGTAFMRGAAAVAATPDGTAVFQAGARPVDWSGQLTRGALSVDAAGLPQTRQLWDAADLLDVNHARRIYTSALVQGVRTTMPFEWDSLSTQQRTALNRPPPPAKPLSDRRGESRLAWLRGDRSEEGGLFRRRGHVLGDAVHSAPLYVGPPRVDLQGEAYAGFLERHKARRAAVYLGANDGMLHAFDAVTGAELFAYVPDALFPLLNRLPDPGYEHHAYIDGPATAAEAQLAGAWRTVLVSAMGGGAQGVFALDITDPADFVNGAGALWEFTDRDDDAMGNVTTPPRIARAHVRTRGGVPEYRYFAVVPSGVNNYAQDGNADGTAANALFLLALDKPKDEAWRRGVNYYRLRTPAGDPALANGLGAPALILDDSGALRHAYAGDLQGNLWRFSFTGVAPWSGASGSEPLFVARDADGKRQPITQQPQAAYAPDGGYVILFGTGRLLEETDRERKDTQSFYAVLDDPSGPGATPASSARPMDRADLARRELDGAPGARNVVVRGRGFSYTGASARGGWYIDFPNAASTGERSTASATLADGKLYFNTILPGGGPCAPLASRSYVLDPLAGLAPDSLGLPATGESTGELTSDYLPAAPAPVTIARTRARRAGGRAVVAKEVAVINFGAGTPGPLAAARTRVAIPAGRISWREVANWRELHQAAKR
ncbi:pilus assembly protein [Pseudoduganella namucuonensis]|uniref:Type IV pilus assembly protein PilY1 n=1 Tax=Pseudoduganella namucuonensis TaxID=1035707 RepID=A0A1I7KW55_9BURK|nr:PilC/PilY family type IV pilus protein [Pseudoduganella namucuonensis]SFV01534.1 type IV pilus assembly protein PilY1 [Pseudoduganella namucuonensis]